MLELIITVALIAGLCWLVLLIPMLKTEPFPQIILGLFILWAVLVILHYFDFQVWDMGMLHPRRH